MIKTYLITVLLLSGCMLQTASFKQGKASNEQYSKDEYQCELDARSLEKATDREQMQMFEKCMESKGYEAVR
jgi:hypothetical protein